MDKFTVHTGTAVPLRRSHVDTDQIIPAVYLKRVTRTGFEDGLFSAWRANEPDFVLNQQRYDGATILIAGNIPGRTRVASVAIYDHVQALEFADAQWLAAVLLAFSFAVLVVMYSLQPLRVARRS